VNGFGVLIEPVPPALMIFLPDIDPIQKFRAILIWRGFTDGISSERQERTIDFAVALLAGMKSFSFIPGHNTPMPIKKDNCPTRCYENQEINKSHCHCPSTDPGLNVTLAFRPEYAA
jgi:hypothetical protein